MINKTNATLPVAIIGAGHAGTEAALAVARMGVNALLFTMSLDAVANMPCNPSIGGTGKGHLVYEIDALGGEMARAADNAAVFLQSRTLNQGKGAAVQSKRIQADRCRYTEYMKNVLEHQKNLRLIQGEVTDIIAEDGKIAAVKTRSGETFPCGAVVVASGTYPNGRIHMGGVNYEAGPDNSLPARGISQSLQSLGVTLMRFKTGTPPRINAATVDYNALEVQPGDTQVTPFSSDTPEDFFDNVPQIPCYIVYTNENTHAVIRENLNSSAMYSGNIHGTGPRYCPSIEDKIVRFSDKPRHQLFLEPMGRDCAELYLQGFSTSMPPEIQYKMLHTLPGFEKAEIMRYAYAIEYDCADPTGMYPTLQFKCVSGLFGAGQFNGTSGYEEAAAQGLLAGMNAALYVQGRELIVLSRRSSYLGTLVDDLVTKGTNEPYRIMTSRSEYRLLLRQDNADERLCKTGYDAGLLPEEKYRRYLQKYEQIEKETARIEKTSVPPTKQLNEMLLSQGTAEISTGVRLSELLRRPEIGYAQTAPFDTERPELSRAVMFSVQTRLKYDGYIKKQLSEVQRREKFNHRTLSPDIDYKSILGLRIEAAQKLDKIKPLDIEQASRISGVNPADITVLLLWLESRARENKTQERGESDD